MGIKAIYNYFFPCQNLRDRRREAVVKYEGEERRHDNTLNDRELRHALDDQFDSLSTTIFNATERFKK